MLVKSIENPVDFCYINSRIWLRSYQREAMQAIVDSVFQEKGLSFVVMFPRQSGKNELQAHLEAYLLTTSFLDGAEIVKISPTWRPQSLNAMQRLERILKKGEITSTLWEKESGYIYKIGMARISFLSGEAKAHIVGATAATLLEVDEAQDVLIDKYDKEIAPMAASTNATRVFWGTAWTSQTLLARELRHARQLEGQDGIRRVFVIDGEAVAREVPAYDAFLREQVERMGRFHPMIKTQFYSEEIDADAGMFPQARQMLMHGAHPAAPAPLAGRIYAFLIDVGGEGTGDEAGKGIHEHNETALTIVEVDLRTLADDGLKAPTYKVVKRQTWQNVGQAALYQQIKALVDNWKPRKVVVDATGIGAGLASFLEKAVGSRVKPFLFTGTSKSNLGWDFLAVCDTGRFKDYALTSGDRVQEDFWKQVNACEMTMLDGPGHRIRWGVADGTHDPQDPGGKLIQDDLLISAALCALLDGERWYRSTTGGGFIQGKDPLGEESE
jgi:hypothetical protein